MAEVYVEGKKLDVFEEFKFSFNYGIADIRHPEQRNTEYSKTIKCPATPNNDMLFGQIYDLNIANAYDPSLNNIEVNFNPNKKASATVISDGVPIMRGTLQLRRMLKRDSDYVYEVAFLGSLADIFGELGEKQLNGFEYDEATGENLPYLDFSEFDHFYNKTNQSASWTAPYGVGYVYPMLDCGGAALYDQSFGLRIYTVEDFKPALYLKEVVDKIFAFAGYTYTSTFLSSAFFKRLIMPLTRPLTMTKDRYQDKLFQVQKSVTQNTIINIATNPAPVTGNEGKWQWIESLVRVCYEDENSPNFDNGAPPQGNYLIPSVFPTPTSQTYRWKVSETGAGVYNLTASVTMLCSEYGDINTVRIQHGESGRTYFAGQARIRRKRGNTTTTVGSSDWSFVLGLSIPNAPNIVQQVINVNATEIEVQEDDEFFVQLKANDPEVGYTNYFVMFHPDNGPFSPAVDPYYLNLDITGGYFMNEYLNEGLVEGELVDLTDNLPEVAMSDLLLSIFNMFNLYVLIDPNQDKNLIIETRDDFYEEGVVRDWSHKVDYSKAISIEPLALLTANEYEYTYTEDSDYYNEKYQDSHAHAYGRARVDVDNDFLRNTNTTEIIFSPTPLVNDNPSNRIIGKIYDSDIEEGAKPTDHNVRVLYYGGMLDSDPKWIHASNVEGWTYPLQYPYAGHLTHPIAPSQDINFGIPNELFYAQNQYTGTLFYTNDNLFNRYHRRGLLETTNKDSKIMTAYFKLSPLDIHKLDFRDQILIDNSYWRLNKVMDYNPFGNDLTKVELVKVITKEPLKSEDFKVGTSGLVGVLGGFSEKKPTVKRRLKNGNYRPLTGGVVRGENNTVEDGVTSFMVQGNNNLVKKGSKDITIVGDNNIIEEGITRVQLINTSGATISESGVTYMNNRQQESSEILDGGLNTVRPLNGGTNIFTVDGGLNQVQAQFSETSIYIIEGN